MSDLATLAIKVDSTGVVTASKDLAGLEQAAAKTEGATKKVETATQSAGAKFAAMARTVMKLTAAFAALAAVQRGWGLMAEAAKYEQQVRALNNLAASYNSNGNKIIADLKRISDGTINTITLVEKAGTAMMLGIAPEKISKLMEIARATARMTGQEVSTAFDNIAMAVGRQSKMILDNLGIIVSVESANRTYAVQLKKTADNLSDTEKKAAFLNATIAAGEDLIARMGQQSDTTKDKMDRLKASVDNARLMIGQGLIRVVLGATGAFQWLAAGVMTVIAIIPKLLEYMARANAKIYEWTGQTERMKASLSEAASLKKGYEDMLGAAGELAGKAADNFSAMVSSTEDMAGAINRAIPPIDGVTDTLDAAAKAAQKLREEADKINETLSNDIKMSGLDDLEKKLFEIQLKYEKLAKNPLVDKGLLSTARGIEESSARWADATARQKEEIELIKQIAAESKMLREAEIEDALFLLDIEVIRGARYNSTMQERLRLSEEFLAIQKSILEKTDSSDVTAYRAQTKAVQDAMKQVIELQKQISDTSPWEGMMRGINSIIDEYENLGSAMESTVVKGIKGMEDALVDFVKTGKLEFKDLADAIIADMIRIMVQQSMLSVMKGASGIGGFLSGILGGLGGAAGSAPVGSFNPGMFSNVAHSGGVIGHGGGVYGIYDSSLFDNAPRLHNGLMPDEFPAILQRGERVIPKNQTGGGGAGGDAEIVTNNITINAVDAKSFSDMCKQNPDAIFGPIMSRLKNNKNRIEMKRALT